ncbi:Putative bacteriophage protein [Alloalcanivorax xenomutans]|uniref:DUF2213 domain-containing protein n=1 Tax=Alloalcanivorax xenomutans TaxID=1094342 RepID=UPI0006D5BFEC|nr:DUF2213 domain-containing protein [Alloalcanivorax xenomutans]CUR48485.1 Putative bacteriophage protein [Alloalcanivorax xenomutans]
MSVLVIDRAGYTITHREVTDEGYLKVPGRVARTGIQQYLASELGLTDRDPNAVVNVYRPPEEVFDAASLDSYDNKDITDDHPDDMVDAASFKEVSVGHAISGGRAEGEYVVVDLLIKDRGAINAVQKGKAELSAGYRAVYEHAPGTTDSGEQYEFVQREIRINHIALVDRARAGREAKLFDKQRGIAMKGQVTLDSKTTIEVEDKSTATLIQKTIDSLRKEVDDANAAAQAAKDEAEKEKAKADKLEEDMEEEKKKASDAAIATKVEGVMSAMDKARKLAGDDFTCDSYDVLEIRRAALAKVRPKVDWAAKDAAYVQAAWDMETEKTQEERDEEKAKESQDRLSKDLRDRYVGDGGEMKGTTAYNEWLSGGKA